MAAKLILKFKSNVISETPIRSEETTIGRKESNDVHIDNLAVSGHHARILNIGKKAILEDMGSTNGTFINDTRVTKYVLNHGDQMVFGKHTLIYVELPDEETAAISEGQSPEVDQTLEIPRRSKEALLDDEKQGAAPSTSMPLAGVQIISGPTHGRTFELSASLTSIGKADSCKIQINGLLIGQQAAVVTRRPNGYHITYLEGFTKPKVNGEAISQEPHYLNSGDIIEIGNTKMEFFLKEEIHS